MKPCNPLAIFTFGLYGEILPNQTPRTIPALPVSWKYGFKSAKGIVRITFTDNQRPLLEQVGTPKRIWLLSNVNPEWTIRDGAKPKNGAIGEFFKRPTLMLTGTAIKWRASTKAWT